MRWTVSPSVSSCYYLSEHTHTLSDDVSLHPESYKLQRSSSWEITEHAKFQSVVVCHSCFCIFLSHYPLAAYCPKKHKSSIGPLTRGVSLTSTASFSLESRREDGAVSVAAAGTTAAAVREEERRVVLAGERDRLRRRPGERDRERDRDRVWNPAALWGKREIQAKYEITAFSNYWWSTNTQNVSKNVST